MLDLFKFVLMSVGAVTLAFVGGATLVILKDEVCGLIARLKWEHKYKHRFDKPPVAKCYCKDCKYYSKECNYCTAHVGWRVAENWFCWEAEPTKYDPEE
jgi:hypothetical protein